MSKNLTKRADRKPATITNSIAVQSHYSGPIPPPQVLAHFEEIYPGAAEKIFSLAEKEAEHRHRIDSISLETERQEMEKEFAEARLGQIFAMGSTVSAVVVTITAVTLGYEKAAIAIWTTTVVGLVAAFIKGRK
jgi:uncharacterized membrane protein